MARRAHIAPATGSDWRPAQGRQISECSVSSNIAQNYPYSSESEAERASSIARAFAVDASLADKVKAESIALIDEARWWVWKCPARACAGLLHTAGQARNARAVYTVCDTCGRAYLR